MGQVEKIEKVQQLQKYCKEYVSAIKKLEKLHSKRQNDLSPKQIEKLNVEMDWQCVHIRKMEDWIHKIVVDIGICDPFDEKEYAPTVLYPTAWHEEHYQRPIPERIANKLLNP